MAVISFNGLGGHNNWKPPVNCRIFNYLNNIGCFFLHPHCGTRREAADFAICVHVSFQNSVLSSPRRNFPTHFLFHSPSLSFQMAAGGDKENSWYVQAPVDRVEADGGGMLQTHTKPAAHGLDDRLAISSHEACKVLSIEELYSPWLHVNNHFCTIYILLHRWAVLMSICQSIFLSPFFLGTKAFWS